MMTAFILVIVLCTVLVALGVIEIVRILTDRDARP